MASSVTYQTQVPRQPESDSNNAKIGFIADKIKTKEADLEIENANYDLVKVPLNRKMEAKKTQVSAKIDTLN